MAGERAGHHWADRELHFEWRQAALDVALENLRRAEERDADPLAIAHGFLTYSTAQSELDRDVYLWKVSEAQRKRQAA